jgi:hypothetical protein
VATKSTAKRAAKAGGTRAASSSKKASASRAAKAGGPESKPAKRPRKGSARGRSKPRPYEKQWGMPAGFCSDGRTFATLREVVDPQTPTLSLSELTPEQQAELVAQRIASQKEFEVAMLGAGLVNKERAVAEVRAQSKIGRLLMEIESRMISNLIEQARSGAAKKGAAKKR